MNEMHELKGGRLNWKNLRGRAVTAFFGTGPGAFGIGNFIDISG